MNKKMVNILAFFSFSLFVSCSSTTPVSSNRMPASKKVEAKCIGNGDDYVISKLESSEEGFDPYPGKINVKIGNGKVITCEYSDDTPFEQAERHIYFCKTKNFTARVYFPAYFLNGEPGSEVHGEWQRLPNWNDKINLDCKLK